LVSKISIAALKMIHILM